MLTFITSDKSRLEYTETESGGIDFSMPVDVLDVCENSDGYIEITTFEKSFVKAPFTVELNIVDKDNMRGIVVEKFGYTCYIMGFDVISVECGVKIHSGDIIGSLKTNKLYLKVYKKNNRVSLKTMRALFNV